MNIWAILLAAGRGSRIAESPRGNGMPKQFLRHRGEPLFWRSVRLFSRIAPVRGAVIVLPPTSSILEDDERRLAELDARFGPGGRFSWRIAYGGERRQDSARNGLERLPRECEAVLVHDAARPFASAALVMRVVNGLLAGAPAVIPGVEVIDTIKEVDAEDRVRATPDRQRLRAVQTPQGFALEPLRAAHEQAGREGWEATDDAALLERCGLSVRVVPGEAANVKITRPEDLALLETAGAESGLAGVCGAGVTVGREKGCCMDWRDAAGNGEMIPGLPAWVSSWLPCTGFGYDVHRYGGGRPFILGGVPIPCGISVAAHSDGDTLLHALMDALLGCIGGGDIGGLFPDTDAKFENIASGILLAEVVEKTRLAGLVLTHVDCTIVAQAPRIAPHRAAIAANVAGLLGLPVEAVNIKATTEERLGFTGEKKGLKAIAVVSGLRPAGAVPGRLANPDERPAFDRTDANRAVMGHTDAGGRDDPA